jgi:nitrite reductase (NADH) small subunit
MTRELWREIGEIDDIPRLGSRLITGGAGDIAVFRTSDDRIFALDDSCPHKQGKLSQGIVHDHAVTCPLHAWVIGLADGEACDPDQGCTKTYETRLEGRRIFLKLGG